MDIKQILAYLERDGWRQPKSDAGKYLYKYEGENLSFDLQLDLNYLTKSIFTVEALLPIQVDQKSLHKVAYFINNENVEISSGNFILNYNSGNISFRSSLDYSGVHFQIEMIESCLITVGFVVNDYYPNFLKFINNLT